LEEAADEDFLDSFFILAVVRGVAGEATWWFSLRGGAEWEMSCSVTGAGTETPPVSHRGLGAQLLASDYAHEMRGAGSGQGSRGSGIMRIIFSFMFKELPVLKMTFQVHKFNGDPSKLTRPTYLPSDTRKITFAFYQNVNLA
jgi:hypothetical protein